MVSKMKGPVFRVTGLQVNGSDEELNITLTATINENLLDDEGKLRFTTAIVPSCSNDLQRVALVEFHDGIPDFLHELVADPLKDCQVEMGDKDITFDRHFFGFTQLYTPDLKKKIKADIIAITGLDGHAYGSWRGKGNLGRMWLRDFLSKDLPSCRTMVYGYNTKLSSHGISRIMDYGRELMEELKKIRRSDEAKQRPLFFIAHSFGGIILTHCLIKAARANEDDHPTIATLHKATYGMLLFGIPHKGLVVDDIQQMLAYDTNHPRSALLQEIKKNSDLLAHQLDDFKNLIRDRKVVSFYETNQTKRLEFNEETKRWERTGCFITLVGTDSALLQLPDSVEEKLPVDSDHSMLVKFDSRTSRTYTSALEKLRQFEREAPQVIAARFAINALKPSIMIPFQRDPQFVGRGGIITNIFDLQGADDDKHCRVAIIGLGGVGKSQIAIEYAYKFRLRSPHTWVFWVHAANASRLEEAYRAIADKVEISGRDDPEVDILPVVCKWLSDERNGHWLMILDNLDDDKPFFDPERPFESFLPQTPNGRILITSRNRTVAKNLVRPESHILQVEPMDENDALALLKTTVSFDESDRDDAKELVQSLEYIPLAITHAAAYIKASALMSMTGYLRIFKESEAYLVSVLGEEKYKDIRRDSSMRHAVLVTWQMSFFQIREIDRSAANLLALMSMFDRDGIPISFLREVHEDPARLDQHLTVLTDFSLVRVEIDKESVRMHRLVQLSMKEWLKATEKTSSLTEQSVGMWHRVQISLREWLKTVKRTAPLTKQSTVLLGAASPWGGYSSWAMYALHVMLEFYPDTSDQTRAKCSKLLTHAYAVLKNDASGSTEYLEAKALLLIKVGTYLHVERRWAEASKHADELLVLTEKVFGRKYYQKRLALDLVGRIYLDLCRYEEADRLLVKVVQMGKTVFGEVDVLALRAMSDLSSSYRAQGRYKEAEDVAMKRFEATKRLYGEEDGNTFKASASLASLSIIQGRLDEAEELMSRALEGYKKVFGEDHSETQSLMVELGVLYQKQKRWVEAEAITAQAIQCLKDIGGEDDEGALGAMGSMVSILIDQARWDEAREMVTHVLEARRRILGRGHTTTLETMRQLSIVQMGQGDWEGASKVFTELIQRGNKVMGGEHPIALGHMSNSAIVLGRLGKYEEAERLMVQSVKAATDHLGADHPNVWMSSIGLANMWKQCGRVEEAVTLLENTIERQQRALGYDHPETSYSRECLSQARIAQAFQSGRFEIVIKLVT